jgi:hypothetical protein
MKVAKLLVRNRQRAIGLVERELKTVVLAITQTIYKIDCTDIQTNRKE